MGIISRFPGATQPDWNQNDSTQPDYIKNRPFYTGDPVETVLVEESTVSFAAGGGGLYAAQIQSSFEATVGETYKVYWDGATYECTCVDFFDKAAIGNLSIVGAGSDTGEPFVMVVNNGPVIDIATADTSASHTVSISSYAESVVKIDQKYLPELSHMDKVNPTGTGAFSLNRKADTAIGTQSFAEGNNTTASGFCSHAEGNGTTASGDNSHAEGFHTIASSNASHAEGHGTKASSPYQHVQGIYNITDSSNTYADIIGNGTNDSKRSNAATVDWSGNAWYAGTVEGKALILPSSTADSTKKFRITVDDDYNVSATNTSDSVSKTLATTEYVDNSVSNPLNIASAIIGQIAKITAVDNTGKPTAWEAVDMPSGSGATQPDWNQNDSTQPDYIKNRPFYTGDPVETVLVEESTVSFDAESGIYYGRLESTFEATVGETYKVSWDGTVYECTCVSFNNMLLIGNLSIIGAGSDTGEPFVMHTSNDEGVRIWTADTSASHTVSISGPAAPIVKIPAKYIDKNSSGYVVIHSKDTMTQQEAENYSAAILTNEVVFIIWNEMCISKIDFGGTTGYDLQLTTQNGEEYFITENDDGVFAVSDRTFYRASVPQSVAPGDNYTGIDVYNNKVVISKDLTSPVVGSTDVLFQVRPDGTKSKAFEVLGNGEAVAPALILYSSTANSTKKFKITVDDSGTISATEVS